MRWWIPRRTRTRTRTRTQIRTRTAGCPWCQISDDSHITHDSFRRYTYHPEASQLRNRNINGAGLVDNTDVMDQFSQWTSYKRSSSPHNTSEKPVRHISQRRTDFTSKDELSKFSKNRNFIFHKGFLKRQRSICRESRQAKVRSRFRNKKELTSVLDYVELEQMDIREVLPTHSVNMHAVRNITSSAPTVTAVPKLRNQIYTINANTRPLRSRNHSIRRKLPKSHPGSAPYDTGGNDDDDDDDDCTEPNAAIEIHVQEGRETVQHVSRRTVPSKN